MGKIPFVKIGGRVRYRWEEIILWIDSQKVR
jgi:predicted DNA-binding transcriptional regulator AlpA